MANYDPKQFKIVDDPNIHEVYANQFISVGYDGRSVIVTVGTSRYLPERLGEGNKEEAPLRVFQLEMSGPCAVDFATSVANMLTNIGVIEKVPEPSSPTPFKGDTWGR